MTRKKAEKWRPVFVEHLRRSGNVRTSCQAAGVSRTTAYRHRDKSKEFAAQWDEALEDACDLLEQEAVRRARDGVEEPVFYQGKQVATVRKYSDTLLIFLLKAHRPEKYRERAQVDLTSGNEPMRLVIVERDG